MKKIIFLLILIQSGLLAACDPTRDLNQPKTEETRSMIIGGVPVHDQDYLLPKQESSVMPEQADSSQIY